MKYCSTRGDIFGLSFEDALMTGWTSNGGILMPQIIPKLSITTLKQWSHLSYTLLVKEIMKLYISPEEISDGDLDGILGRAFSKFNIPDVVHLTRLKNSLNILELYHGATMAFKDLSLSCLGQMLDYFLERKKKHITILVGTSGDTGSAAIESVRGLKWVDIIVLFPKGFCTKIQELQMTTVQADNVHIFGVEGSSDDLDIPIKNCFLDEKFSSTHHLNCINSINWARILIQMAHHFYVYLQMCPTCDNTVEIVVPTGAAGNVSAGCIAIQMGLPVKFVTAVNANDIIYRTITHGDFSSHGKVISTLSCAMDILNPYNVERLLYIFSDMDVSFVKKCMKDFNVKEAASIPQHILQKMQEVLQSFRANDTDILNSIRECWEENNYLICPHTALAVTYHYRNINTSDGLRVCLATASPHKFPEVLQKAGLDTQITAEILSLENKKAKYMEMNKGADWNDILRRTIEDITKQRQKYI